MSQVIGSMLFLALLLAIGVAFFRGPVRADYRRYGRLRTHTGLAEWVMILAIFASPYLFNPPCWPFVWSCPSSGPAWSRVAGLMLIVVGALLSFGSMAWLGLKRSTGLQVTTVFESGLYRWTRNPQVLFGMGMILGVVCLWPSLLALLWLFVTFGVFHAMVLTEEEHLARIHGPAYLDYCRRVPRYVGRGASG
ncbi:MAG: isoprenylcysteine carboxylmethyltransferase family protein [Chloroflexi bacterium]|nr:isoprenylcysteine carboxylmethyltransferase family protein [Chloroflexota bacterium]